MSNILRAMSDGTSYNIIVKNPVQSEEPSDEPGEISEEPPIAEHYPSTVRFEEELKTNMTMM